MAGTNNFQQWNPTAANQESDSAYTSDSLRSGGAPTGAIFPSPTANKLFFQLAQMVCALAGMMANKGYNISDANLANLRTALTNILTNADIPGNLVTHAEVPGWLVQFTDFTASFISNGGWVRFPNGFLIQWGRASASASSVTVNFPHGPFPNNMFVVLPISAPAIRDNVYVTSFTTSNFVCGTAGSTISIHWIALGN